MPKAEIVVLTGEMMLPDSALVRTEYYNDFLSKMDTHHLLTAAPIVEAWSFTQVSLLHPSRVGPYDDVSVRVLQVVAPHLRRALRIHQRLMTADLKANATLATLDRMPVGVILLGHGGQLHAVNRAAVEILAERDGLVMERGELTAAAGAATASIRKLVASAVSKTARLDAVRGGTLSLPRPSGRRPLEVKVIPIHIPVLDVGGGAPSAIVFIVDPEREIAAGESLLAEIHGLTPAEARLARLLASGRSPAEAASGIGVSVSTVRTQLRALFHKTGTSRQAELVGLLHRGLAGTALP